MNKPETMESRLLKLLKRKWITPLDALKEVQCLSLAQRVSNFRADGVKVADKWVELANGKRCKSYRIQG